MPSTSALQLRLSEKQTCSLLNLNKMFHYPSTAHMKSRHNFILSAFSVIGMLSITGCAYGIDGNGNLTTENRTVQAFTGIELSCSANVHFTQGTETSVKVEAEDNIIRHITTEVKNDVLVISTDGKDFNTKRQVNVYVTSPTICLLELTGSGNMTGTNMLSCDQMKIRIAGSGNVKTDLTAKTMKMSLSGSGNLDVSGSATVTDVRIAGSGNIDARTLKSTSSTVSITGSGKSTINVSEQLDVSITGSGDVQYVGEPAKLKTNITGSGNITKI